MVPSDHHRQPESALPLNRLGQRGDNRGNSGRRQPLLAGKVRQPTWSQFVGGLPSWPTLAFAIRIVSRYREPKNTAPDFVILALFAARKNFFGAMKSLTNVIFLLKCK
jgi:hypothetical protein